MSVPVSQPYTGQGVVTGWFVHKRMGHGGMVP